MKEQKIIWIKKDVYKRQRSLSPQGVKTMRTVPRATAGLGRSPGWDVCSPYASNADDFFSPNTYGHKGYTGTSVVIDPDSDTSVIPVSYTHLDVYKRQVLSYGNQYG